jgi:hypothetical protein
MLSHGFRAGGDPNLTAKAQWVRLADVLLIGPLMVWGGLALNRANHPVAGGMLTVFGVSTVLFNGANMLLIRRAQPPQPIEAAQP